MPRMFRGYRFGYPMRRFGFPLLGAFGLGRGLIGTLLTGGLGYLLGRSFANRGQYQTYQPYPGASMSDNSVDNLRMLSELHDRGVLTDEQFENEKRRLLNR